MGLGKKDRPAQRAGLSPAPETAQVRARIARLRQYRWSSYRAYIGLTQAPPWLSCEELLALGGGRKGEQQRHYREYVESAAREGLEKSPWESLKEQVVLGGADFLEALRKHVRGDEQEQRGAKRLVEEKRPGLAAVIAAVEKIKGEKWNAFRDRHGDRGREMVLYLGRRVCGMKLAELAAAVRVRNYAVVATSVKRYEQWLQTNATEQASMKRIARLLNYKM